MAVYTEVIDFLAAGPSTKAVAEFQISSAGKARVADLIRRSKTTGLTADETVELDVIIRLEDVMRLVKAKPRTLLTAGGSPDVGNTHPRETPAGRRRAGRRAV